MTSADITDGIAAADAQPNASLPRPWGFWATLGWCTAALVLAAAAVMAVITLTAMATPAPSMKKALRLLSPPSPLLVGIVSLACTLCVCLTFTIAVRIVRWPVRTYLALALPGRRDLGLAAICVIAAYGADLVVEYVFGDGTGDSERLIRDYEQAQKQGGMPLLWLDTVIVSPFLEEVFYRGFVYRGWSQSRLGVTGTILLTSAIFGLMHVQYSWVGIAQCFCFGLILGWLRWRSETFTAPLLVHATWNLLATIHTAIEAQ
jgi:CAAX protease family protein